MGWEYNSHIVCMCIIMRWSRNRSASGQRDFGPPHYYAHTNYVTIILPSQSCLFSFLHHPYMCPFSICKIFHLLVMYCLRHLLLFTCKQGCLQTCKYDQSLPVTEIYIPTKFHVDIWLPFELWVSNLNEKKKMKNSALHSPIHL